MESLKLNNAPASLFVGSRTDERKEIVAGSRLLLAESHGKLFANARKEKFEARMNEAEYRKMNESISQKTFLFCAKVAAQATGQDAPQDYAEFLRGQKQWFRNNSFLATLQGITTEVISPMIPYTTSNALGDLAFVDRTPIGKTYEVRTLSNDIFVFQDSSWGASRSVPKNYLYEKNITCNPTPKSAAAKVKWYQLVGNQDGGADIGRYYLAMAGGIENKILAMWNAAMTAGIANAAAIPAYLKKTGYTTANWISLAKAVSQANGLPRESIVAYGDWLPLSKVLPSGTSQDAALTYQLGQEWFSRGYMGTALGVPMALIQNAYPAGTVNNDAPTEMLPTDTIWMVARAGEGYAPVYIIFEDDPIVIEMDPRETGDNSIDINMTLSVGAIAPMGSKIGVISSIT